MTVAPTGLSLTRKQDHEIRFQHQNLLEADAWLAAIVEDSEDAILSKTLDGIITSWNKGAQRLFGFSADEAIGQPMTIVIPVDRWHEEDTILAKLRAGERIDHFETIRRSKNGDLLHVSVTVSPVRNSSNEIIGASKILRDITDGKLANERQALLLKEMEHRIKNLFTLVGGLVTMSARASNSVEELAGKLEGRISSLARAHALTLTDQATTDTRDSAITLSVLLQMILEPYRGQTTVSFTGPDILCGKQALSSLALLFHELATNAAKYGALSTNHGRLVVEFSTTSQDLSLIWTEVGGPAPASKAVTEGFGTRLAQASLRGLGGTIHRHWKDTGLVIAINMPSGALKP